MTALLIALLVSLLVLCIALVWYAISLPEIRRSQRLMDRLESEARWMDAARKRAEARGEDIQ